MPGERGILLSFLIAILMGVWPPAIALQEEVANRCMLPCPKVKVVGDIFKGGKYPSGDYMGDDRKGTIENASKRTWKMPKPDLCTKFGISPEVENGLFLNFRN